MRNSLLLLLLLSTTSIAQVLKPDATGTFYSEMWNVYNTHKRINYLSFPWMNVNGRGGFPLLFEANISPYFTFFRGRDYGDYGYSRPHMKSFMIYFNPELLLRMYTQDPIGVSTKSLPVLPINFVPRISFVKFLHKALVPNKIENFRTYHFLEFSVAHYSNGQDDRHYVPNVVSTAGDSIPNYRSGNFSTNYLRLGYTYGYMDGVYNIYSVSPYVQNDGGVGDLFSYDEAQKKSYGKWRLGTTLQLQSKKTWLASKKKQKIALIESPHKKNMDKFDAINARTDYYVTWTVRLNSEIIVDNVTRYPSTNKLIHATRLTFLAHPLNWRNFGIMTEFYYGRDFYNIRFYDRIAQVKLGLLADPNFYLPRNTY